MVPYAEARGIAPAVKIAVLLLATIVRLLPAQETSHSTLPRLIHKVEPEYTQAALNAKVEGTVIISLVVGADGVPTDLRVTRELGHELDEKAIECLKAWRFEPATHHGQPVATKASVEINYRLPEKNSVHTGMNAAR